MYLYFYTHKFKPLSHASVSSEQLPAVVPHHGQSTVSRGFYQAFYHKSGPAVPGFYQGFKNWKVKSPAIPQP